MYIVPYVFDTITSRDRPSAASQAAKTSKIMGIMLACVKCELRIVKAAITNRDNREDIRWDRYTSSPTRDTVNAIMIFMYTIDIW